MTLPPEILALRPAPHPLIPPHTEEEAEAWMARLAAAATAGAERQPELAAMVGDLMQRRAVITAAHWDRGQPLATDPFRDGFELPQWADADLVLGLKGPRTLERLRALAAQWDAAPHVRRLPEALRRQLGRLPKSILEATILVLVLLGGNRAAKSQYFGKRCMEDAMRIPGLNIRCVAGEDMDQSRENQQDIIWQNLPVEYKRLNGTRDPRRIYHISHTQANGFTLDKCILPNGSTFFFHASNTQEPDVLEGKILGHPLHQGIGWWGDESVRLPWIKKLMERANQYNAFGFWSFTPIDGMTPSIKEIVGEARTLMALPAECLSQERKHVPDCPAGWMPYLQLARTPKTAVMYFHTQLSPFGSGEGKTFRSFYTALCEKHALSSDDIKAKFLFGYTRDTSARCFPMWGSLNVVETSEVPETGTLRIFIDPHGNRPYALIKVLTTPGKQPHGVVVGNWPDQQRYGEWAVASSKPIEGRKGLDGEKGPAQVPNGWAALHYKKMLREWRRIEVPPALRQLLGREKWEESDFEAQMLRVRCPWHRPYIRRALHLGWRGVEPLYERIVEYYGDPRAFAVEHEQGEGKKSLELIWAERHEHPLTKESYGPIHILPASGRALKHGYKLVTDLLEWDKEHPDGFVRNLNAPRLYAVSEATQFRWCMENFTDGGGQGDQDGACKEWADLARHYAEADVRHHAKMLEDYDPRDPEWKPRQKAQAWGGY